MKQLVEASYTEGNLNLDTITRIADKLSRKDLKTYIKALKAYDDKNTLHVESAYPLNGSDESALKQIFGNKKIRYSENDELLVGVRITDNDTVYNMNLKNTLERIAAYAAE